MNIRSLEQIALPIQQLTTTVALDRLVAARVIAGLDTDARSVGIFFGYRLWLDLAAGRAAEWDASSLVVFRYNRRQRPFAVALLALSVEMLKGTVSYREVEGCR